MENDRQKSGSENIASKILNKKKMSITILTKTYVLEFFIEMDIDYKQK